MKRLKTHCNVILTRSFLLYYALPNKRNTWIFLPFNFHCCFHSKILIFTHFLQSLFFVKILCYIYPKKLSVNFLWNVTFSHFCLIMAQKGPFLETFCCIQNFKIQYTVVGIFQLFCKYICIISVFQLEQVTIISKMKKFNFLYYLLLVYRH